MADLLPKLSVDYNGTKAQWEAEISGNTTVYQQYKNCVVYIHSSDGNLIWAKGKYYANLQDMHTALDKKVNKIYNALDNSSEYGFTTRQQFSIAEGAIAKISWTGSKVCCFISYNSTTGASHGLIYLSAYGSGSAARMKVRDLMPTNSIEYYVEEGTTMPTMYIKNLSQSATLCINSLYRNDYSVATVDSLPESYTKYGTDEQTLATLADVSSYKQSSLSSDVNAGDSMHPVYIKAGVPTKVDGIYVQNLVTETSTCYYISANNGKFPHFLWNGINLKQANVLFGLGTDDLTLEHFTNTDDSEDYLTLMEDDTLWTEQTITNDNLNCFASNGVGAIKLLTREDKTYHVGDAVRLTIHPTNNIYGVVDKLFIGKTGEGTIRMKIEVCDCSSGAWTTLVSSNATDITGYPSHYLCLFPPFILHSINTTTSGRQNKIRLTWYHTNVKSAESPAVFDIRFLTRITYSCPNNMSKLGVPYIWDRKQNVTFPEKVTASNGGFVGNLAGTATAADKLNANGNSGITPSTATGGTYMLKLHRLEYADGYAGDATGFPVINNANSIVWINSSPSVYGGQLGISSNGELYYRYISSGNFPTTTGGESWATLLTSKNIAKDTTIAALNRDLYGSRYTADDFEATGIYFTKDGSVSDITYGHVKVSVKEGETWRITTSASGEVPAIVVPDADDATGYHEYGAMSGTLTVTIKNDGEMYVNCLLSAQDSLEIAEGALGRIEALEARIKQLEAAIEALTPKVDGNTLVLNT